MEETASRPGARDASPFPSRTPEPASYPSVNTGFAQPHRRQQPPADFGNVLSGTSLGQFSFAPATRTTVVTTTTTTTTNFPPLVMKPPRATRDLDPKLYPLASTPTPSSLRNIKFEMAGRSVVFNEPEDTVGTLEEVCSTDPAVGFLSLHDDTDRLLQLKGQQEALKESNGTLKSVTTYNPSHETTLPRRSAPPRLSRQSSRNCSSSRRRPVSPVSMSDAAYAVHGTPVLLGPGSYMSRGGSRHRSAIQSRSAAAGLATPETEHSQVFSESSLSRRRLHGSSFHRKESLLRSPLSTETEQHKLKPTPNLTRPSGKENFRTGDSDTNEDTSETRAGWGEQSLQISEVDHNAESAGVVQQEVVETSADVPQEGPSISTSHLTAIDSAVAQDMCLPSPSLSPVTAMNTQNADSFFDSTEDQGTDTDSSFENHDPTASKSLCVRDADAALSQSTVAENPFAVDGSRAGGSLTDIPAMLNFFDSVPDELKTYLMYQFLRRCPKPTLHFVADVVNPALKCDFLALLPPELSLNIVKYFDVRTMCRAAQVSKKWRHIINSDEKTWKELFDRDGYVLPEGELQRAVREGWGWQFPNGVDDWEKDLSSTAVTRGDSDAASVSAMSITGGSSDRQLLGPSSSLRRPKRKAAARGGSRKSAKRKISSSEGESVETMDCWKGVAATEGPYAAANAAAAAVPYPDVGLPSLRSLHLYKSLYQRHHSIHRSWMRPDVKPKHLAFRAHDRHVVTCLQFDTDKILTGSDDTNINVYDTKTGALRATLEGHEGGVWALEYHGNTLVSGSTDRSVRVWDIEKAKCTQIFQGHTSTVRCLQILLPAEVGKRADGSPEMMPKEPLIITGSRDSTLRVWKLPKPGDPVYYQAGPHADDADCPYFVRVLSGHQHSVRAIAAHGDTLVSGSYDCTVRVWKISTGETLHRLQGHTLKVYSVVLDHERNRCISGSMDNMVKVWSLETGSLLYNLEGHTSLVGLLDLKCDRLVSAAADSTLRIWDPENGQCKSTLSAHTGAITCFQHDGQKVISGSDRTLKMWNVRTGECVKDLLTELSGVWQVRFNDRRCVAAVQRDHLTYIEVLDFGASRDGVPPHRLGKRIVVDHRGQEATEDDDDYDISDV
ncbi:SCF ubiquitin ligase complex subunit cdc4 [Paecilomyces lecythidis]